MKYFKQLVFILILFRLFIMAKVGFIDDEAYHWTWAKNISYSYYDHPGMVAWLIWPFITLFGDHAFVIRIPGFLMFLGIVYIMYQLAKDLFDEVVAKWVALFLFFIPLWGIASLGTFPDSPLGFFWIAIAYVFWQSVRNDDQQWSVKKSWLWIGFLMGLGMNSKLTVCLIGLGMGLYLIFTPRVRKHLLTPWPWIGVVITFAMMIPVFVWNSKHGWATFEYQFMRRHTEAQGADWNRWLQFWSYQWIFMSPGIYLLMLGAFAVALRKFKDDAWRFILCLPLPALLIFYYQPLMSAYKPHWSGPAYMILFFGAVKLFVDLKGLSKKIMIGFVSFWLFLFTLLYIPLLTPIIPKIAKATNPSAEWNPQWDFSNEFYGWIEVGNEVKRLRDEIKQQTGSEPLLGAQRYELISQLWWGTKEKIWQLTFEKDQFHFDQPESDKQALYGRDFLLVNNDKYARDPREITKFDSCEKKEFPFFRGEFLARTFYIYYCKNFQGVSH